MDRALSAFTREELAGFGGVGLVIAALLVLVLRILLPRDRRAAVRMPLLFLLFYLALVFVRGLLPPEAPAQRPLGLIALLLLLLSLGRSAFLLVFDCVLGRRVAEPLPRIIRDIIQGLIYAAAALVTLRAAGVEPGSLLTTSALLTAVIGLSLQDTLGNVFAGLAIQMQRPFEVGDWIQFDADPENVGRVVEINWRATKVQTREQVEVIVPNGTLAKAPIKNFTKPTPAVRRSAFVQAPYEIAPGVVHDVIRSGLEQVEGVLPEPPPSIVTRSFGDHGIEYWVRYFIDDYAERDVIGGRVRDRIWYALSRAGIAIPFPIRTVHLHEAERSEEKNRQARFERREKILRYVDFLAALPAESLRLLVDRSHVRRFAQGELIIRQGDPGEELYIIDRGEAVVSTRNGGEEIPVSRLAQGQFFGEMTLMTGEARTATVRAARACELLVVDKPALQAVLEQAPELAAVISSVVVQRQMQLQEKTSASMQPEAPAAAEEQKSLLLERIRTFFKL
jgi:small-conductance mechanosensitive channel/CRP-like cAMP-binding protein